MSKPRSLAQFQRIAAYLKARRARHGAKEPRIAMRRRSDQAQLRRKFYAQRCLCFYCECVAVLSILPPRDAYDRGRRATREHLVRWTNGGSDDDDNIVMACADCNHKRGTRPVAAWKADRLENRRMLENLEKFAARHLPSPIAGRGG